MTTVVGLDLSLTATGMGWVSNTSTTTATIRSAGSENATLADRRDRIARLARDIAAKTYRADLAVLEGPSYASKSAQMWDRAWLWGAVVEALHLVGCPVALAPPSVVKKWAANNGGADKAAVAAGVARLWPDVTPKNNNEFDALAMATMGAQHLGLSVPSRAHHADALVKVEWPANVTTKEKQ